MSDNTIKNPDQAVANQTGSRGSDFVLGIAAPSSPFDIDEFNAGANFLRSRGFKLVIPGEIFDKNTFLAGSDETRAGILNRYFADTNIDGIICARGGYGSMRLLSKLDFMLLKKCPKLVAGFSDATALLMAIHMNSCTPVLHSPMVTTLTKVDDDSREAFIEAVTGNGRLPHKVSAKDPAVICPGSCSGKIMGGNLATMTHLCGTPWQPKLDGCILIIEDIGEQPYKLDRMLTQMRLAGCFDDINSGGIKGVAVGDFTDCGDPKEIRALLETFFANFNIPVVSGFNFGHGSINMTIPLGVEAVLDSRAGAIVFDKGNP